MNRRGFLALTVAAPVAAVLPKIEAAPVVTDVFDFDYKDQEDWEKFLNCCENDGWWNHKHDRGVAPVEVDHEKRIIKMGFYP